MIPAVELTLRFAMDMDCKFSRSLPLGVNGPVSLFLRVHERAVLAVIQLLTCNLGEPFMAVLAALGGRASGELVKNDL